MERPKKDCFEYSGEYSDSPADHRNCESIRMDSHSGEDTHDAHCKTPFD